jgi:hypothetical protein
MLAICSVALTASPLSIASLHTSSNRDSVIPSGFELPVSFYNNPAAEVDRSVKMFCVDLL